MEELVRQDVAVSIIDGVEKSQVQGTMKKIGEFQAIVKNNLVKDHDFGVIPGTGDKPTLYKPGAEKILMLMGLTSEYDIIEKVQDYEKGFFAFTVKCILSKNDIKVTEGLGHANSWEGRYRYRWVTEKNIPAGIKKEDLVSKEFDGKFGKYTKYQLENDDPYTLVNTLLKMAKKRAQIDATLTVASLSDVFTQDLEDISGTIEAEYSEPKPASAKQKGFIEKLIGDRPESDAIKEVIGESKTIDNLTAKEASKVIETLKEQPDQPGITDEQKVKAYNISQEIGYDNNMMKALIKEKFGKSSSSELTEKQGNELIEHLEGVKQDQQIDTDDIPFTDEDGEYEDVTGADGGGPDF